MKKFVTFVALLIALQVHAAGTGIVQNMFLQGGSSAIARTIPDKLSDVKNAKDFGVKCDGVTNDSVAAMNAINATTGWLLFPEGTCVFGNSQLTWTKSNLWIAGKGEGATTFQFSSVSLDLIKIGDGVANPNNTGVTGLTITSTVPKTAGAAIKISNGHNAHFEHIRLDNNFYYGFDFEGGAQQFLYYLSNFEINSSTEGIIVGNDGTLVQDLFIDKGIIFGSSDNAILLLNVSGYYFNTIDMLGCKQAFATYPGVGKQVVAGISTELIADSSTGNGYQILTNGGLVADSTFVNSWASSNGSSNTSSTANNGAYFNAGSGTINGITFSSFRATNNKGAGVLIDKATKVTFANVQIMSNSSAGSGLRSGFEVSPNVSNWSIEGGVVGIGGLFGTNNQKFGVVVAAGTSNYYTIADLDVSGNVTGSISDAGTGGEKYVHHNVGYRNSYRGAGLIASGTTSVTIAHGLSVTPAQSDFLISPTVDINAAGVGRMWVSAATATTFTVTANTTATTNLFFSWDVKSAGN